ncbi:MAG TPA: hypothetical protein P5205_14950 [Candidatus Paceibacterota bacterium]|nr:hypothetical protein [Verrucomicrobiota bacterium]HSA11660.1 hypothetical protein [Candidatus Paceibacterota bacterium]
MKNVNATPSVLERWIIGVVSALLAGLIVVWAWHASELVLQIVFILAALALVLLAVLSVAAWRHGFRWFFSRRALRFYGWLAVGIVSVVVLFYAEESWRGKRMWAALQREAGARGESLELSSVIPPAVPEDENFALAPGIGRLLGFAEPGSGNEQETASPGAFYQETGDDWPAATWALGQATDLAAWQEFFRRHAITPRAQTNADPSRPALPVAPAPQAPAADVMLALSRYDSALAVLRTASQRPQARYPLAYEEGLFALSYPSHGRQLEFLPQAAHVLSLRAIAELAQGRSEPALQDTLLALRLANTLREEPYWQLHHLRAQMLMFCVQPVWEGLAQHRWTEPQLAALQQQFAAMDLPAEFRVMARGGTFVFMNLADQLQAFLAGRRSPAGDLLGSERFAAWLFCRLYPEGWLYQDKVWIYRFYERRADVFKAMNAAKAGRGDTELRRATDPLLLIFVVPNLLEAFHGGAEGALYLHTTCQEAVVACALERYRLAQGRYPDSLEALAPAWLKEPPADLLDPNGSKLRYRREGDGGFVLYSIGLNRADDGGRPGPADKNWRWGEAAYPRLKEGDWVWRQPGRQ